MSDSIEQAIEALTQLREVIREAHGVTKDLRAAIKEAKQVTSGLPDAVQMHMSQAVAAGLDEYAGSLERAIVQAEKKISTRFDVLGAVYLGEDPQSIEEGRESLEDLVKRVKRRRGR
jgi:hypothetical protein